MFFLPKYINGQCLLKLQLKTPRILSETVGLQWTMGQEMLTVHTNLHVVFPLLISIVKCTAAEREMDIRLSSNVMPCKINNAEQ